MDIDEVPEDVPIDPMVVEHKEIPLEEDPPDPDIGQSEPAKNSEQGDNSKSEAIDPEGDLAAGVSDANLGVNAPEAEVVAHVAQPKFAKQKATVPFWESDTFIDELCAENGILRATFDAATPVPKSELITGVSEASMRVERIRIQMRAKRSRKNRKKKRTATVSKDSVWNAGVSQSNLLSLDRWADMVPDEKSHVSDINIDMLLSKRQTKLVNPWARGVVIVDNFHHSLRELKFQVLEHFDNKGMDYNAKITRLPKGGKKIVFIPEALSLNMQDFKPRNADGSFGSVHPPRSTLTQQDCQVILKRVPKEYSDEALIIGLIPPVLAVERFQWNGEPSGTVKVTYMSAELANNVIEEGNVLLDEGIIIRAEKPNVRKQLICRTCKRFDCQNKRACSTLRCAYCGGSHTSNLCDQQNQKRSCINCKGDHQVYKCPLQELHKKSNKKMNKSGQQKSWVQVAEVPAERHNAPVKQKKKLNEPSEQMSSLDISIVLRAVAKGLAMAMARSQGLTLLDEELQVIDDEITKQLTNKGNNINHGSKKSFIPSKRPPPVQVQEQSLDVWDPTILSDVDSEAEFGTAADLNLAEHEDDVEEDVEMFDRFSKTHESPQQPRTMDGNRQAACATVKKSRKPAAPVKTPESTSRECSKCSKSFKIKGFMTHFNSCRGIKNPASSSVSANQQQISRMFTSKASSSSSSKSSQC